MSLALPRAIVWHRAVTSEGATHMADDTIVVVRDREIRGCKVLVTAERIRHNEGWLVVARVDGALHDAWLSESPEREAERMLAEIDGAFH